MIKNNKYLIEIFKLIFCVLFLAIDIIFVLLFRTKTGNFQYIWLPLIGISCSIFWCFISKYNQNMIWKIVYWILFNWYLIRGVVVVSGVNNYMDLSMILSNSYLYVLLLNMVGLLFINLAFLGKKVFIICYIIVFMVIDFIIISMQCSISSSWLYFWLPLIGFVLFYIIGFTKKLFKLDFYGFEGTLTLIIILWSSARGLLICMMTNDGIGLNCVDNMGSVFKVSFMNFICFIGYPLGMLSRKKLNFKKIFTKN